MKGEGLQPGDPMSHPDEAEKKKTSKQNKEVTEMGSEINKIGSRKTERILMEQYQ